MLTMYIGIFRDETSCHVDSHMVATSMRAAYTQQAGNHFQPQSPVCVPQMMHLTMMDDLVVRFYNFLKSFCSVL